MPSNEVRIRHLERTVAALSNKVDGLRKSNTKLKIELKAAELFPHSPDQRRIAVALLQHVKSINGCATREELIQLLHGIPCIHCFEAAIKKLREERILVNVFETDHSTPFVLSWQANNAFNP